MKKVKKIENKNVKQAKMRQSIIFDNGLTLSIFGNPNHVKNIQQSDTALKLAANSGILESNQVAEVPGFGIVWYDLGAIALYLV